MNKNEARLLLNISENENIDDVWEQKLFEQKQFFLTRPPIPKVFRSRINKLEKLYSAYLVLKDEKTESEFIENQYNNFPEFSDCIKEAFNQQQAERMKVKSQILRSENPTNLAKVIENWLELEKRYMKKWTIPEEVEKNSDIIISKEPDPMYILEDLKTVEESNNEDITFDFLKNNLSSFPKRLISEFKRLNLLYQISYG